MGDPNRRDDVAMTGRFPGGEVEIRGRNDKVLVLIILLALGISTFVQHHQMTQATDRLTCILSMTQEARGPALSSGDPCSYFYWIQRTPPGTPDIKGPPR